MICGWCKGVVKRLVGMGKMAGGWWGVVFWLLLARCGAGVAAPHERDFQLKTGV